MVLCWFVDETGEDSRKVVDLNELEQRTGVLYHKVRYSVLDILELF